MVKIVKESDEEKMQDISIISSKHLKTLKDNIK